jgi:NAD-dependent dihydropyrimidine dehydrogenase PreA subunit
MPFIIAEPCIGVKDKSCVEVCPVNCIYEGEDQYYIHPTKCIDCQACEAACPVQAIFPDNGIPEKWQSYIEKNKVHFENNDERLARLVPRRRSSRRLLA